MSIYVCWHLSNGFFFNIYVLNVWRPNTFSFLHESKYDFWVFYQTRLQKKLFFLRWWFSIMFLFFFILFVVYNILFVLFLVFAQNVPKSSRTNHLTSLEETNFTPPAARFGLETIFRIESGIVSIPRLRSRLV